MFRPNLTRLDCVPFLKMSVFACMQRLGWDCLFGVFHSVMSLSLIYPLCDAYLAPIFSTYTHAYIHPHGAKKDAGVALIDIVIKSGLNSRTSACGANNELASHNTRNALHSLD